MIRYIVIGLSLSSIFVLTIIALIPSSYDFAPDNPLYNGLSSFMSMYRASLAGLSDVDSLGPGSAVLVIGPGRSFTESQARVLRSYVERGGLLVVADDFGSGNSLLSYMGVNAGFDGRLLSDPVYMYRNQRLPIVAINISGSLYRVYLNYATVVRGEGGICIGYSSVFSYLDANLNGVRDSDEPWGPFCIAYRIRLGGGEVYVISDPSIFINAMISMGDNQRFLDALLSGKAIYVLTGYWISDRYSETRSLVIGFIYHLLLTPARYLIAAGVAIISAIYIARIYRGGLERGFRRGYEDLIDEIVSKHPDWDPGVLRKLAREVLRDEGRG